MTRSTCLTTLYLILVTPILIQCNGSDGGAAGNYAGTVGDAGSTSTTSGGHSSGGGTSHAGATSLGGMMNMGGEMNMGGMTGSAGGMGADGGEPQAPVMNSVTPLGGALHVGWTNITPNCDKIELLRNMDGGDFAVAYALTGAATSQHDGQVTAPSSYCYKARCVIGASTSMESNEKCGTP